ncbi:MAG: S1/P1 nuclease [Acidobacteriota bacterium]
MISSTEKLSPRHAPTALLPTVPRGLPTVVVGILLLFAGVETAHAWRSTGHFIVAQIAYDQLSPEARQEVDRLSALLVDLEPPARTFVAGSVWLDGVREIGVGSFDRWHYINLPINGDGVEAVVPAKHDNAVVALSEQLSVLRTPSAGDRWRAFALRVVSHLVGDLHQPLHCVNRYTHELPQGDRGGNDFLVVSQFDADTLHGLWDTALGLYPAVSLDALESPETLERLAVWAAEVAPLAPADEAAVLEPELWAREGHRLARDVVYVGIEPGTEPSNQYLEAGRAVAARRLALAGHRLGALLEEALGVTPPE